MINKKLIYTDKAGNKLYEDVDSRLIVLNAKGKLVRPTEIKPFIKQPVVKNAINSFYSGSIKPTILNPKETNAIKPKFKGGVYR
jgi:hypothetical protein